MDVMGPLPITEQENSYILTIQDLLTKYLVIIPMKSASAISIANAFTENYICIYGAPKAVLTDQGSHFLNSLMTNIARKFKIKHFKTTAYHPQSNGSVERSHHVIWEYLKQFTNKYDWDKYLAFAAFSYNTSVHEGTRYTPYQLIFGKLARTPK
jgi:transposase InsO family protein